MSERTISRESIEGAFVLFCSKPIADGICNYICTKAGILFDQYHDGVLTAERTEERIYDGQNRIANLCEGGQVCSAAPETQIRRMGYISIPEVE